MTITTTGRNKYRATFNRRHIAITNDSALSAVDTSTGEIIEGNELHSIKNLVQWHIKSKLDNNELPTLWTVKK
jgi:hypothetical protein